MRRALRLAARGRTSPNPMVGAVLVRGDSIVGEGFHHRAGEPHAEVLAIAAAGDKAGGATLYVNLEPCSHRGRTPPCAKAIIQAGVSRVVAAMTDPNPLVSGAGFDQLRAAGIEVEVGILEQEARRLNEAFVKYITTGLPFFRLKMAMTIDGKIATKTGDSRWVSGEAARCYVQRLRRRADAVMVGIGTLLRDDPLLTVRGTCSANQPLRVIVDALAQTPPEARLFEEQGEILIAASQHAPVHRIWTLEEAGARILLLSSRGDPDSPGNVRVDLAALARELAKMEMTNVLVEGGGELAAGFVEAGLADAVTFFISPKIVGGRNAPTPVEGAGVSEMAEAWKLHDIRVRRFGEDVCVEGYLASRKPASDE